MLPALFRGRHTELSPITGELITVMSYVCVEIVEANSYRTSR